MNRSTSAIVGTGFFGVKTPQGVRYTRDGQFTASAQGLLVTHAGQNVLSQSGAPIKVGSRRHGPRRARSESSTCQTPSSRAKTSSPATPRHRRGCDTRHGTPGRAGGIRRQPASTVMVEMVGSLRTFQSGQQAIQAIDQTLQAASTQVGSLNGSS